MLSTNTFLYIYNSEKKGKNTFLCRQTGMKLGETYGDPDTYIHIYFFKDYPDRDERYHSINLHLLKNYRREMMTDCNAKERARERERPEMLA